MAIGANTNWRVRPDGDNSFGGGYDADIAGGSDQTESATAALTLTDLATPGAGSTTLTSVTGGFTDAMLGNCFKITSGTNFDVGYYFMTARASSTSCTLDRTPTSAGAGSGGNGKLGGAFATLEGSLTEAGSPGGAPTVTSPLAAGHTINVRGSGSEIPTSADYSNSSYHQFIDGDLTTGKIKLVGYNGRPAIWGSGTQTLALYNMGYWEISHCSFKSAGTSNASTGMIYLQINVNTEVRDCVFDQNGIDCVGAQANHVENCYFHNSGSSTAGTHAAVNARGYAALAVGNEINAWKGSGIESLTGPIIAYRNLIYDLKATGGFAIQADPGTSDYASLIANNTIDGCANDGIVLATDDATANTMAMNNIITYCTGYGISHSTGTTAVNDRIKCSMQDYNAFKSNTGGNHENASAGDNDVTLSSDPYDRSGVYELNTTSGGGADCQDVAFPVNWASGTDNTNYAAMGAVEPQITAGGGAGTPYVIGG